MNILKNQIVKDAFLATIDHNPRFTAGHNVGETDIPHHAGLHLVINRDSRHMDRLAMSPPVTRVHASVDGDVGEEDIFDRALIPCEYANSPIGAIDHEILKYEVAHVVGSVTHTDATRAALEQTIADRNILRHALLWSEARHTNRIIAGA